MPSIKLDKEPKTASQIAQEAAMAQRLLNDEVFCQFLEEITNDVGAAALSRASVEEREYFRVQFITMTEFKARIEGTAALPQEIRDQQERDKALFE